MPNAKIILADGAAGSTQFEQLLNDPNKVLFVVLGDSAAHQQLADAAEQQSQHWRHTVWAKHPDNIYPRLLTLPLRPGVLPILSPFPPTVYAVSISVSNYICRVVNSADTQEITPAFILAETYMHP